MIYINMNASVAVPVDEELGIPVYSPAGQIVSTSSQQSDCQTSGSPTSFVYPVAVPLAETRPDTAPLTPDRGYANGFQRPDSTRQILSSCFVLCSVVIIVSLSIYGVNQVRHG